jgi:hypothetical protein
MENVLPKLGSNLSAGIAQATSGAVKGVRSEIQGIKESIDLGKQQVSDQASELQKRAAQAANLAKAAVTTWLNTTGWGRLLTNKYTRTGYS